MMKTCLYLFFALWHLSCIAQYKTIKVINEKTQKPIPYATVSFFQKNVAYATDGEGLLQIDEDLELKASDSLSISSFGYQTKKFAFGMLNRPIALAISPNVAEQKKLQLGAKDVLNIVEPDSIDRFAGMESGIDSSNYLQLAQKFYLKQTGAILNEITLYQHLRLINNLVRRPAYESSIKWGRKMHFRLRFYEADSLMGKPGRELTGNMIEVTDAFEKTIKINLARYNIVVPGNAFFVAVEWIRTKANGVLLKVPLNRKISDEKYIGLSDRWENLLKYMPSVAMSPRLSTKQNTWKLNLNHQWQPYTYFAPEFTDLAITVKLNYLK
jgi:hypothetical protein